MTSQVLSEQSTCVGAFVALLRAHAGLTRDLNAQLTLEHGLTLSDFEVLLRLSRAPERRMRRVDLADQVLLSDFEVLLRLSRAPERRMRRVDLADQVLLSASGVTRLLDGLERQGLVARAACDTDRRVVYAVLADEGLERLEAAAESHFAQVDAVFGARFDEEELGALTSLLDRLASSDTPDCAPDSA